MSRLLHAGDRVRVRPAGQILATLDEQGRLDGLPFMPEMLAFCGREFTVYRRADKVCDTISPAGFGFRRMRRTVHLDGVRCDGSAHGGCQYSCLMHWKEAWLEPAGAASRHGDGKATFLPGPGAPSATAETLAGATAKPPGEDGAVRYSCQATEILGASEPMSKFNVTQYWRDVNSGNATVRDVISMLGRAFANHYQNWSRKTLPKWLLIHGGRAPDVLEGALTRTPAGQLHLQPGERVRVKSRDEIVATLDKRQRNRGLAFYAEMIDDCDTESQVVGRISQMIDERNGTMRKLANDCLILDGKVCNKRLCPRSQYKLWHDVWLSRVDGAHGE